MLSKEKEFQVRVLLHDEPELLARMFPRTKEAPPTKPKKGQWADSIMDALAGRKTR
jgi:hypothetical protein